MPTMYPTTFASRKPAPQRPVLRTPEVPAAFAHLETPQSILTPTHDDTLTYWRYVLASKAAVTIAAALHPFAEGRACGTGHVGYRIHRRNTNDLIREKALVLVGHNEWGRALYRLACPVQQELGPCATESEMDSWFRQCEEAAASDPWQSGWVDSNEKEGGRA